MKTCPKCGAENKPERLTCYKCSASISGVQDMAGPQAPGAPGQAPPNGPVVAGPAALEDRVIYSGGPLAHGPEYDGPVSEVGKPLDASGGQQAGSGYTLQEQSPYGPPRMRYKERESSFPKPVKHPGIVPVISAVVPLLIILGGGLFAYWWFEMLPRGPKNAVLDFIKAVNVKDPSGFMNSLDSNSQRVVQAIYIDTQRRRANPNDIDFDIFRSEGQDFNYGKQFSLKVEDIKETTATVFVKPGPVPIEEFKTEDLPSGFRDGYPFYVVKVGEKEWKVDLVKTWDAVHPGFEQKMKELVARLTAIHAIK